LIEKRTKTSEFDVFKNVKLSLIVDEFVFGVLRTVSQRRL